MVKENKKQGKNLPIRQPRGKTQNLQRSSSDLFGQPFLPSLWEGLYNHEALQAPATNVIEKYDKFVAKVELPRVHEEDVNVVVMGDILIVEGEKEAETEVKKKGYSYSETSQGSFSRSLAIPSIVDSEKISANFDKGVSEIDLPKSVEIKPHKVSVSTKKKEKSAKK